jgi:hypothetical protein
MWLKMGISQPFFVSGMEIEQAACHGLWNAVTVRESFLCLYVKKDF